ncbi:MAG: hypothetical protein WD648_11705 [Planctomycetaceae bacterium]
MPDVDERKVFNALLRYRTRQKVLTEATNIEIEFRPVDNSVGDSPDFLLWLEVRFELFGQPVKVVVPIPVEAEKGGIHGGALEDLRKLIERRKHLAEIPMMVVSESGYDSMEQIKDLATRFQISQVPVRRLESF